MKKYFILLLIVALIIPANCSAMKLEKAVELGSIATFPPSGAFRFEGTTSNNGTLAKEKAYKSGQDYAKGIACFGSGDDALYVHYDNSYFYTEDFGENVFRSNTLANSCKMGSDDVTNTLILPMGFPHSCTIYQIINDKGLTMYLLQYATGAIPSYKMIGKRDGKWVKYFETVAAEQYYGMRLAFCYNYKLKDDTIIFEYGRYSAVEKKFITYTELHFIWNDADRWFGVDCKTYIEDTNKLNGDSNGISNNGSIESSNETSEE